MKWLILATLMTPNGDVIGEKYIARMINASVCQLVAKDLNLAQRHKNPPDFVYFECVQVQDT